MSALDDIPEEWRSLGGDWRTETVRSYFSDQVAVYVEQRISPRRKVAAMVPVSAEVLADVPSADINHLLVRGFDRYFRPWLYFRLTEWPSFEPFPRWARFSARVHGWWHH